MFAGESRKIEGTARRMRNDERDYVATTRLFSREALKHLLRTAYIAGEIAV